MNLETGLKEIQTEKVIRDNTAKALGSGSLLVYGTPAMLLLIEKTAVAMLEGRLDEGLTSVGTKLNVDHISATPVGGQVVCTVELVEIDRKRLVFHVEVTDAAGLIGKGSHERFIVDSKRFQEKADSKLS